MARAPLEIGGSDTLRILKPKKCGLVEKQKPWVIIISSPYDEESCATNVASTAKYLEEIGYVVLNKKKCTWDTTDFKGCFKPIHKGIEGITLWIEAHGAPGWFFGGERSSRSEVEGLGDFLLFTQRLGVKINSVVLNGCFTANEIVNPVDDYYAFNCSPARMLSILLDEAKIIGFIGQNADGKVSSVYKMVVVNKSSGATEFQALSVNPEEAAVLYVNGVVVQQYTQKLFCNHRYTPQFIEEGLGLGDTKGTDYYLPCDGLSFIRSRDLNIKGYALLQLASARLLVRGGGATVEEELVEVKVDVEELVEVKLDGVDQATYSVTTGQLSATL